MEILFALEPVAKVIAGVSTITAIISVIIFFAGVSDLFFDDHTEESKKEEETWALFRKWGMITLITSVIIMTTIQPLTQPFDIYKKILIYRGIKSKTADKLVDNFDKLMDISAKKLEEWEKKK